MNETLHISRSTRARVLGITLLMLLTCVARPASAYTTTEQHAFTFDDRVGIYTIEFKFGHESHDIYLPILALHGTATRTDALSYQILDENENVPKGIAAGIVLSNTRVVNGMYYIPKGSGATFTLLTFFTPSANEHDGEFKTQVTHLPFNFDGTRELKLNPSELTYYTTELLPLAKHP